MAKFALNFRNNDLFSSFLISLDIRLFQLPITTNLMNSPFIELLYINLREIRLCPVINTSTVSLNEWLINSMHFYNKIPNTSFFHIKCNSCIQIVHYITNDYGFFPRNA
jgi:hypothetical protein